MKRLAILLLLAAGCTLGGGAGATSADGGAGSGSGESDSGVGGGACEVSIAISNAIPITAGPTTLVHAQAEVDHSSSELTYAWSVTYSGSDVAFTATEADGSQIAFPATGAGVYHLALQLPSAAFCPAAAADLDVLAPGANMAQYRLRFTPDPSVAPPQEKPPLTLGGGADFSYGPTALDGGTTVIGAVLDAASRPVPAYVKLVPDAAPGAGVETFTGSDGSFSVRVVAQAQHALIVPTIPGYAPAWVPFATTQTRLTADAGSAITGTVTDPSGAPLAGATVQLELGGVPSTLATTGGDGTFSLLAELPAAGTLVTVEVVPPAASGLPRLLARSSAFVLTSPLPIAYAPTLALRTIANLPVNRDGSAATGSAWIVGTMSAAGTVGGVDAEGVVRIAVAVAGALPATTPRAPATPLSAVIDAGSGGLSVTPFDLTASVPASIESVSPSPTAGTVTDGSGAALAGVNVVAVPAAELAAAGVSPLMTTTGAGGAFALPIAAGGSYDLHVTDPQARAAPLVQTGVTASATALQVALPAPLHVLGIVTIQGVASPVAGVSVQILCDVCDGVDAQRPIAETVSDAAGSFTVVVPDPGVAHSARGKLARMTPWDARMLQRSR